MVKYMVRLNTEEREQLLALVTTGRAAAVKLLHARILRKADVEAGGRRWTDAEIAAALDTSAATVQRGRQAWVEAGMEAALSRKRPTGRQYRKLERGLAFESRHVEQCSALGRLLLRPVGEAGLVDQVD